MRFVRFAPAVLLAVALALWFLPWVKDYSGFHIWQSIFETGNGPGDPVIITLQVVMAGYPLFLLCGTTAALGSSPSRWRAAFVGGSALLPLVALTGFYLYVLILEGPRMLAELTVWFYLSHAVTLGCVILSVREYTR